MKTFPLIFPAMALLAVLAFAGCATPASRISKNPEAFARLTPEQQNLIRHGRIAVGFNQEMVQLALGEPDRITTRTDASGVSEIWRYTMYETADGMLLYRGWYHRYYGGWDGAFYPYYLDYPYRREHDRLRVTFKNGKVVAIEEQT